MDNDIENDINMDIIDDEELIKLVDNDPMATRLEQILAARLARALDCLEGWDG